MVPPRGARGEAPGATLRCSRKAPLGLSARALRWMRAYELNFRFAEIRGMCAYDPGSLPAGACDPARPEGRPFRSGQRKGRSSRPPMVRAPFSGDPVFACMRHRPRAPGRLSAGDAPYRLLKPPRIRAGGAGRARSIPVWIAFAMLAFRYSPGSCHENAVVPGARPLARRSGGEWAAFPQVAFPGRGAHRAKRPANGLIVGHYRIFDHMFIGDSG